MRKQGRISLLVLCLLVAFLLPIFVTDVYAVEGQNEKTQRTVVIGYISYEGFIDQDRDGTYSGYGVEYLEKIAEETGWKYEYVYDSWENHLENLRTGKIDLLCHAQPTAAREEEFIFSKYSDGAESSILYVGLNDDRYYFNDYEAFEGMTIGVLEGSFQNEEFASYAEHHGFTYQTETYSTVEDAFRALDQGELDGVAVGSLAMRDDYKVASRFGSDPFYFMSGKENVELIAALDEAMGNIKAMYSNFDADLYEKYYGNISASMGMCLTRQEAEFIAENRVIDVAFIPNRAPFSADLNGEINGITRDVMDLISKRTGLKFNYVMMETGQTPMDYLSKDPAAVVTGVMTENPAFTNSDYYVSDGFFIDDVVLAGKKSTEYIVGAEAGTYKIAISSSYSALLSHIKTVYPQFDIITCSSTQDGLNMVRDGSVDFVAQNRNILTPWLQNPHYEDMRVLPTYLMQESMGMVMHSGEDNRILLSIINKCITTITDQETAQFSVDQTLNLGYKPSVEDFIYKFRYALMAISLLGLLLILSFLVILDVRRRANDRLQEANDRLELAVQAAEHANSAKSQFLAQMSHEIRTPMNAVIGMTNIAKSNVDDPEKISDYLTKIDSSSRLLLGIINDVLDMSAIEGGKMKIEKAEFDFKRQLSGLTSVFYQQAKQKGVEFHVHMHGITEEMLVGDELRTNQILMNLLSNAVKFTPSGGRIDLYVIQASKNHEKVFLRFRIKDTGCGMAPDMMSRLFKPFEQESASTARKHGGSGLGLSIAKNLVDMMGGSIKVTSQVGVGTEFTVDLPFGLCDSMPNINGDFSNIRALVVDDDTDASEYCTELLDRLRVSHEVANTGEKALELLGQAEDEENPFQLCIIDWQMPGMDGLELTREIREYFGRNAVVVVVSAYDLTEIEEKGKVAGADYFMSKPLFQSTIFNALMRIRGDKAPVEAVAHAENYDFTGKRVLVAEDVVLNMEVALTLLRMVGVEAVGAEDGQQALDLFLKNPPGTYDCILLDINMPVMDGYEAAQAIRKSNKADAKTVPIYAMTANAFAQDVTAAMDAGMNGHIAKPIETKILYETLNKAFELKGV